MAKKLADIQVKVEIASLPFFDYLKDVLDYETYFKLHKLSYITKVYIFSGVIRNFFLGVSEVRDIDIVLESEVDLALIFTGSIIKENSFGGYKISVGKTTIDLWYLRNTWAIKHQPIIHINLEEYIPNTAFFNFSAIIFSFNEKRFIYTKSFLGFLRDKTINFLYKPNANYSLCIVNSFYYSDKYNLKIASKLSRYLIQLHKSKNRDYELVQSKHFGEILYTNKEIDDKIVTLSNMLWKKVGNNSK